jgi:VIT1/CCC1 family predicted Fe2+/Mn2+ transporter
MYSKKEDFTNTIQFLIGERIESLEANSYSTIEELAKLFQDRNDKLQWKALSFLNIFYIIKSKVESLTSAKDLKSTANINKLLSKTQKTELIAYLKENEIKPPEFERAAPFETLVYLFPVPAILGTMLVCTYYITKHDYSGWIYLFGLVGLALSILLLIGTAPLKTKFKEDNLVDYAKLTYTVKHKVYCQNPNTKEQLIQFLTDELEVAYGKRFMPTEMIPEN